MKTKNLKNMNDMMLLWISQYLFSCSEKSHILFATPTLLGLSTDQLLDLSQPFRDTVFFSFYLKKNVRNIANVFGRQRCMDPPSTINQNNKNTLSCRINNEVNIWSEHGFMALKKEKGKAPIYTCFCHPRLLKTVTVGHIYEAIHFQFLSVSFRANKLTRLAFLSGTKHDHFLILRFVHVWSFLEVLQKVL